MIAFGFSLLFSVIGSKGLHHFLKQSGLKLKLICNLVSFLVSNSVLIGSYVLFSFILIGSCGFTLVKVLHSNEIYA